HQLCKGNLRASPPRMWCPICRLHLRIATDSFPFCYSLCRLLTWQFFVITLLWSQTKASSCKEVNESCAEKFRIVIFFPFILRALFISWLSCLGCWVIRWLWHA